MSCVHNTNYSHFTNRIITQVYITMAMLVVICNVLTTCGFTVPHERDYITTNEGLDCWDAFTIIDLDDFEDIAKSAL